MLIQIAAIALIASALVQSPSLFVASLLGARGKFGNIMDDCQTGTWNRSNAPESVIQADAPAWQLFDLWELA